MPDGKSRSRTPRSIAFEPLETRSLLSNVGPYGAYPISATFTGTFASALEPTSKPNKDVIGFSITGSSTVPNLGTASLGASLTEVVRNQNDLHLPRSVKNARWQLTLTSAVPGGPLLAGVSVNVFNSGTVKPVSATVSKVDLAGIYHVPWSVAGGHVTETGTLTYKTPTSGIFSLTFKFSNH